MSLFFRQLLKRLRRDLGTGSKAARPGRHRSRLGVESLDGRIVPATLLADASGVLTYTAGENVFNNLTIELVPSTPTSTVPHFSFHDTAETITGTFEGTGTNTVFVRA